MNWKKTLNFGAKSNPILVPNLYNFKCFNFHAKNIDLRLKRRNQKKMSVTGFARANWRFLTHFDDRLWIWDGFAALPLIKIKFFHEAFLNELFTDNNKNELLYICQYASSATFLDKKQSSLKLVEYAATKNSKRRRP